MVEELKKKKRHNVCKYVYFSFVFYTNRTYFVHCSAIGPFQTSYMPRKSYPIRTYRDFTFFLMPAEVMVIECALVQSPVDGI